MRIKDVLMIQSYVKQNRNRSIWRKLVRSMACVVVFCTVYAMILPVITIEQNYICGMDVHEHTDACRAVTQNGTLLCTDELLDVHRHDSSCYDTDGSLRCGIADKLLHTHEDTCYDSEGSLICQLTECKEHRHSGECYADGNLICGREELYRHTHGSECHDENDNLICGVTETRSHRHTDKCPVLVSESILYICDMEAHIHTDTCLASEKQPTEPLPQQTEATEPPEPTAPTRIPDSQDPEGKAPVEVNNPKAGESDTPKRGYPTAVKTGYSEVKTLYFYNFEATSSSVRPLAGCVFEIRSTDGSYVRHITSSDSLEINLPSDIPVGDYIITQLSAPYGYMRDDNHTRSFSVGISTTLQGQKVFKNSAIGSFMNHSLEDADARKTAEVENYNNRTYEIILSAAAQIRLYEMEPIDILFVVDQSNSMLFPSGLQSTGKKVRFHTSNGNYTAWNMEQAGLDKNQLYYVIADPHGTSTVFAVWHNGTSWMYQDASYYAKAWHDNRTGYRQDDETAAFPSSGQGFQGTWTSNGVKYKANGGDLGYSLGGTLGNYITENGHKDGNDVNMELEIYTAVDQYNRLHYLEESITNAVYLLSDANPENTVTVIRFTKDVDESHCLGPLEMTPENANKVIDAINKIQTDGGTRQDLALDHAYKHLTGQISTNDGGWGDHYTKDKDHTFTVLITDGAPVRSDGAPELNVIYQQIRSNAAKVRNESTLITIGLGMEAVTGGKAVLEEIASLPQYANILEEASDMTDIIEDLIFDSLEPSQHDAVPGEITDVISDSFYPIAWVNRGQAASTGRQLLFSDDRDWVVLEPGDWIDVNGRYLGPNQGADGEGQLVRDSNGDLVVRWTDRQLRGNPKWTGRFFVKAKEDFIGGNAIETNKEAYVVVDSIHHDDTIARMELPNPTVNVHLLDLNQHSSEVTVFLGDLINEAGNSPLNALEYFYNNTRFTKLLEDLPNGGGMDYGPVMNAIDPDASATDGLHKETFSLAYAMGQDLTMDQWAHLMESQDNTVRVDYTYDDASSHGPVGYFTFRLTKTGDTADYLEHTATVAGEHVEEYILHVTYTAYELGDNRPDQNVHNGSAGPGTEVADENGNGRLENGYGIVDKDNIHIVNVIEGAIEVTKEITADLISDTDQVFRFTLHRAEDGDDHSGDRSLEIRIPAGQTTATIRAENLPRGTWILTEQAGDAYHIRSLTILDTTNCYAAKEETAAVFHIGDDTSDRNVIGKREGERYAAYTGTPEGVFGAAKVVNEKTYHYTEIPVQKVWGGTAPLTYDTAVYLVLYRNADGVEQLVLDTEGNARILRLDAANDWQGAFRVALPDRDTDPATLGYFVREVSGVSLTRPDSGQPAILENDGSTLLYYKQTAQPEDILELSGNFYMVTYSQDSSGSWTVTNHIAVTLPNTGGSGTQMYTISGLVLVMTALIIGYSQRRRRERGADH